MNKARKYDSPTLRRIAERIPEELSQQNDRRMGLAVKITEALRAKGLTNQEFAFMMGKKPSEITRWLSGTHNFTTETLWEIERVLKIQLLTSSPKEDSVQSEDEELSNFITLEIQKALAKFINRRKLAI